MAPISFTNLSSQPNPHHTLSPLPQFALSPLWLLLAITFLTPVSAQPRRTRLLSAFLSLTCVILALSALFPLSQPPNTLSLPTLIRQDVESVPQPDIILQPPALPSPTPPTITQPTTPTTTTDTDSPDTDSAPLPPVEDPVVVQDIEDPDDLSLDSCSGGLVRMQVVLFIELLCEIFFVLVRCLADAQFDDDSSSSSSTHTTSSSSSSSSSIDITYRGFVFVRGIYTVPVIIINAAIYWIGGGNTGACLSKHPAIQLTFTHLIFYVLYCVLILIVGIYRIDTLDESSTSTTSYYDTSRGYSYGPPTRSFKSFIPYYSRSTTSTSSYSEPKFRFNLGCCAINF